MTTKKLIEYIKGFEWTRKVTQLHIHHSWKPDHSDYNGSNGLALQQNMRNFHIGVKRWKDIGQHLTLLPDGQWVTGRDYNQDPASITGWNEGAFAIEMLGNFDTGNDKFEGKQAEAMYEFCAFFIMDRGLTVNTDVKFHRDNPTAGKTCPGSGIDRKEFMANLWLMAEKMKALAQDPDPEEWKYKSIDNLATAGIVLSPENWKSKINEPMPVWAAMALIDRLYQVLKGNGDT